MGTNTAPKGIRLMSGILATSDGDYFDASGLDVRKGKPTEIRSDRPVIEQVEEWLTEAGMTLATLRMKGLRPAGVKINWPDIVVDPDDLCWLRDSDDVLPPPSSDAIARMDIALAWVPLIDDKRLRVVVNKRLIVNPISGKFMWSWRKIAGAMGISDKTAKDWHRSACAAISKKIRSM